MAQHHPGTGVNALGIDLTNVPWALTTHLLSVSAPQFKRTTQAPFLAKAAQGRLPKEVIAQWLAEEKVYVQGYIDLVENLANLVRKSAPQPPPQSPKGSHHHGVDDSIEARLLRWLDASIENIKREAEWFDEMTSTYGLSTPSQTTKSVGLQRFESLFDTLSHQQPHAFLPWLEGAVCLFSTEKVYYEAWSWARRQAASSPKDYSRDLDGGAMRKEFIPNWSNKMFMMFVEMLERIINEGVSRAVQHDDMKWREVKTRADAVWRATLDAEEAFWPDVEGQAGASTFGGVGVANGLSNEGIESRRWMGAKEGSLIEPNKQTYIPHVGVV